MEPELSREFSRIRVLVFDFDGVFTDNRVFTFADGSEAICSWRSDGLGVAKIKKLGLPIWVISTEKNPVVGKRCDKLGIDYRQGCDNKVDVLDDLLSTTGFSLEETAFTGNDINDVECLKAVGMPIVVADAHPDVLSLARYVTERPGGKGAVREVCDLVYENSKSMI